MQSRLSDRFFNALTEMWSGTLSGIASAPEVGEEILSVRKKNRDSRANSTARTHGSVITQTHLPLFKAIETLATRRAIPPAFVKLFAAL